MDAILADAAIARALHLSAMSSHSAASLVSAPAPHHQQSPLLAAAHLPAHLTPESPPCPAGGRRNHHQQQQLAPAGGRAGKRRRSRASKRAPTTYITTDPANFRIMVQHITSVEAELPADMLLQRTAADIDTLLLPADAQAGVEASSSALALHQQPCFPTLDSWNVMYDDGMRSDLP
ncbi:calmodulin-binding protein 25-like [Panicum virgatum]|uniref:VQ domain-containing protein n=1 Tax=Panicum virgatum TaxID=38727 RepID=A0A8T0WX06_PANVG|nr:calmodulin-binding protein 25-like [Panicum virgatum]KAG2647709.1 hypothetical protein PVAP13_2KG569400 [Panicum virgatum]